MIVTNMISRATIVRVWQHVLCVIVAMCSMPLDGLCWEANETSRGLLGAMIAGDEKQIEELLLQAVDLNFKDSVSSKPLLIWAVELRKTNVVGMLLEKGAYPNSVDSQGSNALIYAVNNKDVPVIDILMKHGTDPYMKNENNESAYSIAQDNYRYLVTLLEPSNYRGCMRCA